MQCADGLACHSQKLMTIESKIGAFFSLAKFRMLSVPDLMDTEIFVLVLEKNLNEQFRFGF